MRVRAVGFPYVGHALRVFHSAVVPVALFLGIASCGPASPNAHNGQSSFSRVDSAGIIVAVSAGKNVHAPVGWHVDPVPDLAIGDDDSTSLHNVRGVKPLRDGGVLVVDAGSQELRFFDASGRFLMRAGGSGEGPGEFRAPVLVPWVGSDSLLLFDQRLPRLQVLTLDGQLRRTIRLARWPAGRVAPLGAIGPDALLFERGSIVGGEASFRQEGLHKTSWEYVWLDPATGQEVAIDSLVVDITYKYRGQHESIPFRLRPSAVVAADGMLIASGRTSEIREYDRAGRLRRILRVDQPERPVTREMIATARLDRLPGVVPIPRSLPFWGATGVWANGVRESALVIDSEQWLWAQVYVWDRTQPKEWMVFDPEGRAHGIVRTPRRLQVLRIQEDYIWGVWRDDFGVESVRRYALRGRTGAQPVQGPSTRAKMP